MFLDNLKRFMKRKPSLVGGIIIILFLLMAFLGPSLVRHGPHEINLMKTYEMPSRDHLLGTDSLGRDTLSRLVYGSRVSLFVSFVSVFIGSLIGTILGVISGYYGSYIDIIIMRTVDILLAFPGLLLAIVIVAVLGTGLINVIAAIAFYTVPYIARIVRSEVIKVKESEFVESCVALGGSDLRVILIHVFPNSMSQLIVNATLRLGTALLTASALSFLGLGVQPPNPEWGAMLNQAKDIIRVTPIPALAPGIAITLVVLSFSLVGDGLRDALDPRLK